MDDETREALMGHKLRASQGNYFDYHDIIAIAKNYMACDWSRGNVSKIVNLSTKVENQAETIKQLQTQLEGYQVKEKKVENLGKEMQQMTAAFDIIKTFLTDEQLEKLQHKRLYEDLEKEAKKTKKEEKI
jgi:hypothetical protein